MNVSVIVPAWNAADTVAETIVSLLAQTHTGWEAIVVDDGSTDATARVAEAAAGGDPRVRVFRQGNCGEAAARNAGLAVARSDWLLFLDADDWIAPEHLERLTSTLSADPSLDAVHCGYARVTPAGGLVTDPYEPPAGDMFAVWARRSAFPVHACVVRRALVDAVGGFDTSLQKSADWDLWQRVARTGARFGAVREVLAFYRMRPAAASLEAAAMLRDGLRVLRRGHAPDPRVPDPHPDHARGMPPDRIPSQAWYLLSWCAGLAIGNGDDATDLFERCPVGPFPELYAPAVARCIFDAAPLALCEDAMAWERLWPSSYTRVQDFLTGLEHAAAAPGLAEDARSDLLRRVLRASPAFAAAAEQLDAAEARLAEVEAERDELSGRYAAAEEARRLLEARQLQLEEAFRKMRGEAERNRAASDELRGRSDDLERRSQRLAENLRRAEAERDALLHSPERRTGDLVLNRLRLGGPLRTLERSRNLAAQRAVIARLRGERTAAGPRRRVIATACWNFPIHSQTFVYQELTALMSAGYDVRLVYSKEEPRDQLQDRFSALWPARRRLHLDRAVHTRDFEHYRRRLPTRIDDLVDMLSAASGLSRDRILSHGNFLEAFTFTRMVEAYRPSYIHSYFFYDRSLMALVAGYLLDIPRGVSCYSDHLLDDYELKVVPLHLELCDLVVATSERIRGELLALAPARIDADKILVKPNGIDTARFPVLPRSEPAPGEPFRLVTVARIEPKKGLLELVEAVRLLRDRGVRVEAHIVGAPDEWSYASREYRQVLDERISALDLWGTVHLEGRQDLEGVLRFHGVSHLFVAPFVETGSGDKDGIPTALLEGMATGLPAVVTDAGSMREVVRDGREGRVVPQKDATALADAIQKLLSDSRMRSDMGERSAALVRSTMEASTREADLHARISSVVRKGRGSANLVPITTSNNTAPSADDLAAPTRRPDSLVSGIEAPRRSD